MKKVKLNSSKVQYDGTSFIVVYTDKELKKKFNDLKKSLSKRHSKW